MNMLNYMADKTEMPSFLPSNSYILLDFRKWCKSSKVDHLQPNAVHLLRYKNHLLKLGVSQNVTEGCIIYLAKINKISSYDIKKLLSNHDLVNNQHRTLRNVESKIRTKQFREFLEERNIYITKSSIPIYRRIWDQFKEWCVGNNIEPLMATPEHVIKYISYLIEQKTKPSKIKVLIPIIIAILKISHDNKANIFSMFESIWPGWGKIIYNLEYSITEFKRMLKQRNIKINYNDHSIKSYYYAWNRFSKWCKLRNIEPLQANTDDISSYISYLLKQGIRVQTIKRYMVVIVTIKNLTRIEKETIYEKFQNIWSIKHGNVDITNFKRMLANQNVNVNICEITLKVYMNKWSIFSDWCYKNKIEPLKASIQEIINYTSYLANKSNRPRVIQSYLLPVIRILKISEADRCLIKYNFPRIYSRSQKRLDIEVFKRLLDKQGIKARLSKGNIKALRWIWNKYSNWCASHGIEPLKAKKEHIAEYITYLFGHNYNIQSIRKHILLIVKITKVNARERKSIFRRLDSVSIT